MYSIIVIIAILILIVFFVWASADIGSNVYLKTICKAEDAAKTVALTFDDGPDATMTPRILDVLKKYDIKATFFLIGYKAERNPEIVRRVFEEGHVIGNHTYSHKGIFPLSGKNSVEYESQKCDDIIVKIIGKKTKLFRPPFGVTNPIIADVVRMMNHTTIGWSIRSLDTMKRRRREQVCDKVIRRLHDGAIILLHDRCNDADVLLEKIIKQIYEKGYNIKPLDEMLKIENVYED